MAPRNNLTGQRFGKLVVLEWDEEKTKEKKRTYWKCQCDCGNLKSIEAGSLKNGRTQSCGCYNKEQVRKKSNNHQGESFGLLTIIGTSLVNNKILQICQCQCGNKIFVPYKELKSGKKYSCGCQSRKMEKIKQEFIGQKFGKLTVLELDIKLTQEKKASYWKCKCDCGNIKTIAGTNLKKGFTQSCGCIGASIGENNIKDILIKNNIYFITEKTFSDFTFSDTQGTPRYDFYLPEYNRLIEFDGEQHFNLKVNWPDFDFETLYKHDKEKNLYAKNKGIELIRIPYYEKNTITLEMLLGNQYLVQI